MKKEEIANVELINDILRRKLILLINDIGSESFVAGCTGATISILFGVPLISMNDNQDILDRELAFFKPYTKYLLRMMYAEVLLAYKAGGLVLDETFEESFLKSIEDEEYTLSPDVEYMIRFMIYYYKAIGISNEVKYHPKELARVRKIDPLYH